MYTALYGYDNKVSNTIDIMSHVPPIPTFQEGTECRNKESVKAQVDPFPFVPVTCITFSRLRSSTYESSENNGMDDTGPTRQKSLLTR